MAENEYLNTKTLLNTARNKLISTKTTLNSLAASVNSTILDVDAALVKLDRVTPVVTPPTGTVPIPNLPGLPGTYTRIANEYQQFTVAGNKPVRVRFGKDNSWIEKVVVGGGACTTAFFGGDPLVGEAKFCEVLAMPEATAPVIVTPPPPVVNTGPITSGPTWQPPLIITEGGVYTGAWQSNDPDVPALTINTSEIVEIRGEVKGAGDLIRSRYKWCNLIMSVRGTGTNPNDRSRFPGRFMDLQGIESLLIQDCSVEGAGGIYVNDWRVGGKFPGRTVTILRVLFKNMEGRYSDGNGGWRDEFFRNQAIQFNHLNAMPNVDVGYNRVDNEPRKSRVEDVFNASDSSGTPGSWMNFHHNLINGAFGSPPQAVYSGGGIMMGDSWGEYQQAVFNTVLETSNYGIAQANGNYGRISDNIILGTGKLIDGTIVDADPDAGIYVRAYDERQPRIASSIIVERNTVGWGRPLPGQPNRRWDISVDVGKGTVRDNILKPDGPITQAMLDQAKADWINMSIAQNQIPGFKN